MLSKKMAFSLMSLITIIALAFVVMPAMAGDFSTAITVGGSGTSADALTDHDVSHEKGEQRTAGTIVTFNVTFGQVVTFNGTAGAVNGTSTGEDFEPADLIVRAYDENGAVVSFAATDTSTITNGAPANGKNYVVTSTIPAGVSKLYVQIPQGVVGAADPTVGDDDDANEKKDVTVSFLVADPDAAGTPPVSQNGPDVLKIARVGEPFAVITSAEFMVHVLLSEDAKTEDPAAGGLTKDLIDVGDDATVNSVVKLASPAGTTVTADAGLVARTGETLGTNFSDLDTWRDGMLHLYLVTIGTKPGEKTVTVKVKDFAGMENPAPGTAQEMYIRAADTALVEGRDKLTVKTNTANPAVSLDPGHVVNLTNKRVLPMDGYLIVATDPALTGINLPDAHDADDNSPKIDKRTPAEQKYNVIKVGLPNLEAFLINGGTIDLVAPDAGISISEIMWGSDASLETNSHSQWIEIKNTSGKELKTGDKTYKLIFYGPNETLPDRSIAANNIQDRVGTVDDNGVYWNVVGTGQNGRSGHAETKTDLTAVVPTLPLISMYRVAGTAATGNTAAAWMASRTPAVNIDGANRVGSPGDEPHQGFATPTPTPTPEPEVVVPAAMPEDIMITEIMVDTGAGRLPQWIELTNVSGAEVSLSGWSVEIENTAADADVIGTALDIKLKGTLGIGGGEGAGGTMGKSLLLVGGNARSSSNLSGSDRVVDVSSDLGQRGRYTLLSPMGFLITLLPPQTTGVLTYGDMAGNLDAATAWDIPMDENGRSSLIRREMDAGMATKGTDANGWILASRTPLVSGPATWYGSDEDAGTPGYNAGGPLPVELSHFRPARDKQTGAVVITWATQSELNNAGFFIKRSQQRDGEFKVINATMIAGAGTTSEKQFYTYTDTTAQPNVVYYYQIEDVSLDGQRQTLTRGIRLKGHIGAAGKLTSTWGEIKASNE